MGRGQLMPNKLIVFVMFLFSMALVAIGSGYIWFEAFQDAHPSVILLGLAVFFLLFGCYLLFEFIVTGWGMRPRKE
jgi:hypothetical protein